MSNEISIVDLIKDYLKTKTDKHIQLKNLALQENNQIAILMRSAEVTTLQEVLLKVQELKVD